MKIGMISLCYTPLVNGVIQMIDAYYEHLERLGHEVTIFTLGPQREPPQKKRVVYLGGMPLGSSGYYARWRLGRKAQAAMQQMDILHAHHLFIAIWLARVYGASPIVYTNHTRYDLYVEKVLPIPQSLIDRMMAQMWPSRCRYADAVIAPSTSAAHVLRQFNVATPIEVIENGIDQRPFLNPPHPLTKPDLGLPETAVLLTYVGRLSKEKNVAHLLHQFSLISQEIAHVYLMLIGDGPSRSAVTSVANQLAIQQRVLFCGQVAHTEIPNYLAASDIFVTASVSEIHPLTLIEAMCAGLPVVAPDAPGNRDIVRHEITGLLIDLAHNGLANGIKRLVLDSDLRTTLAEMARSASGKYTIAHTVDKTVALYERLLTNG